MQHTNSLRDIQLEIEQLVTGCNLDPNPIVCVLSDALEQTFDAFERKPAWVRNIQALGINAVAYLSITSILDNVSEGNGVAQVHGVLSEMAHRFGFLCEHDRRVRLGLAWNVLHACRQVDLVRVTTSKGSDPTTMVSLTRDFKDLLDEHELWGLCGMTRRPMLCPPVPHTLDNSGGYLMESLRVGISHGSWDNIIDTPIIDAMNKIQATPLRVNERVLDAAEYLMQPHLETGEANAYSHGRTLAVARELCGLVHYNPTQADYRGRINLRGDVLSMQGNDLSRGLIEFHNQYDVDERALYWILVQVANSFAGTPLAGNTKTDKLPFDERVAWTHHNIDKILSIASDPISCRDLYWNGFASGASTFQALLAAVSLAEALTTGKTRLPVRQDMTTNNYQWSAVFMRDLDLGTKTNLVPDVQNDLHSLVAGENLRRWQSGECDHEYVDVFLDHTDQLISRKAAKPAGMVIGYGGKCRGIANLQLGDKTWTNLGDEQNPEWVRVASQDSVFAGVQIADELVSHASFCLAQDYEQSVYTVAPAAKQVTDFLRECVKVANAADEPLTWTTASGVRVFNKPTNLIEFNLTAANCWDDQTCTQLKYKVFDKTLNKRKAMTAAPPQFTHSQDGTHLHFTVNACHSPDIQTIHDCYAVPATHVDNLRQSVLATLAVIMDMDVLSDLSQRYNVPLPKHDRGELTVDHIMHSTYALS